MAASTKTLAIQNRELSFVRNLAIRAGACPSTAMKRTSQKVPTKNKQPSHSYISAKYRCYLVLYLQPVSRISLDLCRAFATIRAMFPAFIQLARPIHILLGLSLLLLCACDQQQGASYSATEKLPNAQAANIDYGTFPISHNPERQAKIGPEACVECHADEVADWKSSHHAKANRPISIKFDRAAFTPVRRIKESGVTYEMAETDGKFELRVIHDDDSITTYDLVGVIGETPLRQYLAQLPGDQISNHQCHLRRQRGPLVRCLPGPRSSSWRMGPLGESRHELECQLRVLPHH
jgi:hypothetical protein